ncbi:MAG: multiprotein-bridging factor 1 family protein [Candidatus Aenigmatarchaeota archaeon]
MECLICGAKINKIFNIELDGNTIEVCKECARRYGNVINIKLEKKKSRKTEKLKELEEDIEIVENYGEIIKEKMEKMGLTLQELAKRLNIKESQLSKIENGELIPDKKLLEKIEKSLKLKLEEKVENITPTRKFSKKKLRIADIVKIK